MYTQFLLPSGQADFTLIRQRVGVEEGGWQQRQVKTDVSLRGRTMAETVIANIGCSQAWGNFVQKIHERNSFLGNAASLAYPS